MSWLASIVARLSREQRESLRASVRPELRRQVDAALAELEAWGL